MLPDLHVVGGCDLFITKAAGKDKKLYKTIEHGLEAKYQSDLSFSKSLSPPQAEIMAPSLNLSRSSPFGNLGRVSSRRTYAYLIATMNVSHPDYDFSQSLRPSDFKRERSLRSVMNNMDSTLSSLRPRPMTPCFAAGGQTPLAAANGVVWGPRTWRLIDNQMSLRECEIYRCEPENYDLFEDDEDGSIWNMHYFFFNKARKRVCYLYVRGISVLAINAGYRTPYFAERETGGFTVSDATENEIAPPVAPPKRPLVDDNDNYVLSEDDRRSLRSRSKSTVRGVSEDVAEAMEV